MSHGSLLDKDKDNDKNFLRIGVIGGGIASLEIILAVKKRLESELTNITKYPKLDIFFLTKDETPFSSLSTQLKEHCLNVISENNITVVSSFLASKIGKNCVLNHNGDRFYLDLGIIATGPSPQPWARISGLSLCENGYVRVKDNSLANNSGTFLFLAMLRHSPNTLIYRNQV